MITLNEVREICDKVCLENGAVSERNLWEDISCIVYRVDVFECGEATIIDRHIDIEYSFGEYYEIPEDTPIFAFIRTLCELPLLREETEMILYQRDE